MNTFKKGDVVKLHDGRIVNVRRTDGPWVYHDGFGDYNHFDYCTLVPQPKFKAGDVVRCSNGSAEYTIKCVKTKWYDGEPYDDVLAYDFTSVNDWNPESGLTLVRSAVPIIDLIKAGQYIEAIKQHRIIHGTGLKEAKDAVDAIARDSAAAVAAPKFKVGDRVTHEYVRHDEIGTVVRIAGTSVHVDWKNEHGVLFSPESSLTLAPVIAPTIVIRRDPGKGFRPNDNPRVHNSVAEATKEAERLALANPGVEFFTFSAASTSVATAPVKGTVSTVTA